MAAGLFRSFGTLSIFPRIRDAELFADFFYEIIVDVRMTWNGCFLEVCVVDEDAMPATFPKQDTVLPGKIMYEQVPFHARATFL